MGVLDRALGQCDTLVMIGLDEVGRGCWAGPLLVVGARASADLPQGLKDSKLLNKKSREKFYIELTRTCAFGEGWVSAKEIDKGGLANALRLGISRALLNLKAESNEDIILDGKVNYVPKNFTNAQCLIDADALIPIVSAAGIYAKVRRDEHMSKLKELHPNYGFEKHVGYGTAAHRLAIVEHGIIRDIHRMSFRPIQLLAETKP